MNDLEKLKRAEEAEPMAVIVVGEMPKGCVDCWIKGWSREVGWFCPNHGMVFVDANSRPYWCPIQEAIGIIEPGCHVRYFREEEE